jgi:exonuclease SbcC
MITRITLENYMSHARTVIEPAAGLTVLVGPNNCGKSAVVSALQTVCGDHAGDFMVRHGEKACQVTLETDDGHVVTWRRIKGKVSYVIDGTEVHRVGRGNLPDGLDEILKLCKVEHPNGDKEFDVHFGNQKLPIFLIDQEGDAAAFFSTASDAEKLLEVQKKHKEKVTQRRRQQRDLNEEVAELDMILAALAPLDDADEALKNAEKEQSALAEAHENAKELGLLIGEVENRTTVAAYHGALGAVLGMIGAPPVLEETAALEECIERMVAMGRQLDRFARRSEELTPLAEPPVLEDESALTDVGVRLSSQVRRVAALGAEVRALVVLCDPPAVEDVGALAEFVRRVSTAKGNAASARRARDALISLAEPPAPADTVDLENVIGSLGKGALSEGRLRGEMAALDAELAGVERQINAWLCANPTCPTCGGKTTREAILAGAHAHAAEGSVSHEKGVAHG